MYQVKIIFIPQRKLFSNAYLYMDARDIHIDGEQLQFDKFDFKNLIYDQNGDFLNPRIAVIAKSGSGKSWVIRDIMYHMRDIACGTVIAPTDKMSGFYNEFILIIYTP